MIIAIKSIFWLISTIFNYYLQENFYNKKILVQNFFLIRQNALKRRPQRFPSSKSSLPRPPPCPSRSRTRFFISLSLKFRRGILGHGTLNRLRACFVWRILERLMLVGWWGGIREFYKYPRLVEKLASVRDSRQGIIKWYWNVDSRQVFRIGQDIQVEN